MIRRASRGVPGNIAEVYQKRLYPKRFVSKMVDADGECVETKVWLDFTRDCGYLSEGCHSELTSGYEGVDRMIGSMIARPERFKPYFPASCLRFLSARSIPA